jgi:hypothetical protein
VENGFPHLPSGCAMAMERQARETILASIKRTYQNPEFRIRDAFSHWPATSGRLSANSSRSPAKTLSNCLRNGVGPNGKPQSTTIRHRRIPTSLRSSSTWLLQGWLCSAGRATSIGWGNL